jgi:septum site-determining protein MinC
MKAFCCSKSRVSINKKTLWGKALTTDNLVDAQVIKLKGRLFTITVIQVFSKDVYAFEQQIEKIVNQAPKLFYKIPVVLDFSALEQEFSSLLPFFSALKKFHLYPVGVQGPQAWLMNLAALQSVPLFQSSSSQDKSLQVEEKKKKAESNPKPSADTKPTKVVMQPIRSGQQVVSKRGDLIVISSVGHGAELLADGNIHVYGPLRGRALAGIAGDKNARIFCTQLDAELVSIAGFYRLRESIPPMNGPCQIFIQDDRLQILPL